MAVKLETAEQWRSLFDSINTVLFDCQGVLFLGSSDVIPQAGQTIDYIRALGKRLCFVTNSSIHSRSDCVDKFQSLNFTAYKDEMYPCSYAAAHYLKKMGYAGKVYLMSGSGTQYEIEAMGMKCIGVGPAPLEGNLEDWMNEPLESDVGAVVIGADYHISYLKIMRAVSYLNDPACIFIATNEDSRLPTKGKVVIPGAGSVVAAVKAGAEREPIVSGKPSKLMYDCIIDSIHLEPSKTLMIGDSLNTDILFGRQFGLKTLLVLTGVTKETDLQNVPSERVPDFYTNSISDLLKVMN